MTGTAPAHANPDDWRDSRDIEIEPGHWAPRYFRCTDARCLRLVTYGQVALGGCVCGNGRLVPAGRLDRRERWGLKLGRYALTGQELAGIRPLTWKGVYGSLQGLIWGHRDDIGVAP
jgi:hypothetical protein